MPLAVKKNETLGSIQVCLRGTDAVMPRAQMNAHALQQLGLAGAACRIILGTGFHPQNFRFA